MAAIVTNILVPYDDFMDTKKKAAERDALYSLIDAEFPDEECRLVAMKSVVGWKEPEPEEEEPEVPDEPVEEPENPTEDNEDGDATEDVPEQEVP